MAKGRVIGKTLCNYELLETDLCEIQRAINQRPLIYVADKIYKDALTHYYVTFS